MNNNNINREYRLEDLENLLDNVPYAAWIKDEFREYSYVNKYFSEMINIPKDEIIGKVDAELGISKNTMFMKNDEEVLNSKTAILTEEKITINGAERWYEVYKSPLSKKGIKSNWIMAFTREITIDKSIEHNLDKNCANILYNEDNDSLENKGGIRKILNNVSNRLGSDGTSIFLYNKEKDKFKLYLKTGIAKEIDDNYTFNISDDIKETLFNNNEYIYIRKTKESLEFTKYKQYSNTKYNGYIRIYCIKYENELIGAFSVYYKQNNIPKFKQEDFIMLVCDKLGIMMKNRMLSKKLKLELEMRIKSEKELELFLETATDLCGVADLEFHYIKITNNWTKTLGWSEEELKGMNIKELVHPDDLERIEIEKKNLFANGKVIGIISRYLCKDGKYKIIEWNWSYIKGNKSIIITGKDKTEEKNLEEDNKRLENAIALEGLKTEFFANMSHEFKTPLNIILTTLQLISVHCSVNTCKEKEKIFSYIKGIKQNSYRLLRLVNNLIDITKIDGKFYELKLGNFNIVNVIEEITLSVADYIGNKGKNIVFDTNEEEVILACDPEKIERILLNLLSNAMKYTLENGNIEVTLNVDWNKKKVFVHVKDDGTGIPDEFIESIFIRFRQANNLFHRRFEGSGIGLSLVKSLVEMHGGNIWVNRNLKEGAEFIFDIPIRKVKNEQNKELENKSLNAKIETCNIEFSDIYSV